jgi:glycosyltransferase involved in cell wall biosynthesis
VPNDELCDMLSGFDLFAVHTDYWELNKSVLEALLTGLPVIINHRNGPAVPELEGADFVRMVDNTAESYAAAINELMADDEQRAMLGRRAYRHAQAHWSPTATETTVVEIYQNLLMRQAA